MVSAFQAPLGCQTAAWGGGLKSPPLARAGYVSARSSSHRDGQEAGRLFGRSLTWGRPAPTEWLDRNSPLNGCRLESAQAAADLWHEECKVNVTVKFMRRMPQLLFSSFSLRSPFLLTPYAYALMCPFCCTSAEKFSYIYRTRMLR